MVLLRWNLKKRREGWGSFRRWRWNMKMKEMGEKMGEMGEMGKRKRKGTGSFCMRVGIFVSMYFNLFLPTYLSLKKRSFLEKNSLF